MIYAYIRVSTDRQTNENQRFEIKNYAKRHELSIDTWVEETISSTKKLEVRKLNDILLNLDKGDKLIVSELSRLGRNLMQIMSILNLCMEKDVKICAIKENYELGNDISAKVLAFAFGLSAEIERNLISQRTKEALARKKAEGVILGRPKGSKSKKLKLSGKEEKIRELLEKRVSVSAIGRILGVHRITVTDYIAKKNIRVKNKL
jgi:DNA invertase Pin-like site-specific DNA recombinase